MGDTQEDPVVSMLVRQLAALEKRCIELETRCSSLEAPKTSVTAATGAPVSVDEQTKNPVPPDAAGQGPTADKTENKTVPSRVKVIISKVDEDGEPIESEGELQTTIKEDNSEYAFILKRFVFDSTSQNSGSSEINITNPELWDLLKFHLRWYPYHIFSDSPVTLNSPFEPIVFSWDLLEAASKDGADTNRQAKDDLKLLLDTISSGKSGDQKLDKFFKSRSNYKGQQQETVQFDDLWTIFAPGTLIYGKPFQNEDQVFVVKDSRWPWPRQGARPGEYPPWSLEAWSYDWDGSSFRRTIYILNFEHFDGHKPVTTLPYYPLKMHADPEEVRSRLIKRGKLFQRYCNTKNESRMFDYKGYAILEKKGFSGMKTEDADHQHDSQSSSDYDFDIFHQFLDRHSHRSVIPSVTSTVVNGRVMVDYASFYQYGSTNGRNGTLPRGETGAECGCPDCQGNEVLAKRYRTRFDKSGQANKQWEDEQYLLCPPRVLGYVLADKQWAQLQVSNLTEIAEGNDLNAWNSRLKLADNDTKDLLFDLVRCHVSSETQDNDSKTPLSVDDIVPGKGKGLVILLYGPPGVGKSSTAETIAVAARKPLFSISVADVGTKAKHVESNLSKIFNLATYWKAILLIDEADVFLESRGRGGIVQSMDKNALVSVFLRVLEYYRGIMFLTTNQIAEFDIAIPSRIHIAIKYESLRTDQMEAIFKGFLDNLHKQNLVDDYDDIMTWLKEDVYSEGLDGRQIRNTITTALDLANAEAKYGKGKNKLGKSHIKRAFNNTKKFKRDFDTQMQRYKDSQNKMIQ
ncbi:hypothetical protein F5Y14DRAFT_213449 [Nemania sp. NC0429]|nr:hypothetical protein F5Y14DRAFT_213449 [Nemania sp. NC0429]